MLDPNGLLSEQLKFVNGLTPTSNPAGVTPQRVSLKGYNKATILINVTNAGAPVGSAIALKQSTNIAGAGEKALAFTKVRQNLDCATSDTLVDAAVTNNTFTTDGTASKNLQYEITVDESMLDINGGFDCLRADVGNATAVISVQYMLWPAKYGKTTPPSAIVD